MPETWEQWGLAALVFLAIVLSIWGPSSGVPGWLRRSSRVRAPQSFGPRSNVRVSRVNLGNPWRFVLRSDPFDWRRYDDWQRIP